MDRIDPSEGSGPGSNPGRDIRKNKCPASVEEAGLFSMQSGEVRFLVGVMNMSLECGGYTRLCDGRRPGSTPGEDTLLILPPEPDGLSTACKAAFRPATSMDLH